jgi:hypothetical protein
MGRCDNGHSFFLFWGGGGSSTGVLYFLGRHFTATALFALISLETGLLCLHRPACSVILFYISRPCQVKVTTLSFFFHWNEVLQTFLPWLVWNRNPPNLSLPCSLGWQTCATAPSCWLTWDITSFLPGLTLKCKPPDLSLSWVTDAGITMSILKSDHFCITAWKLTVLRPLWTFWGRESSSRIWTHGLMPD